MVQEEIRKGPWTEQEDFQLVCFVGLFGDRRWDFIAKVSGLKVAGDELNRTGKSCRLRWVNYLHPGLKRGKMTPLEERQVLELHSKWGNRWSKIARKLPGRTDNEIKNYWRTHMRKKAQERKRIVVSPSSSSSNYCSSSSSNPNKMHSLPSPETGKGSFFDTGGLKSFSLTGKKNEDEEEGEEGYSMDEIWKYVDTNLSEESAIKPIYNNYAGEAVCNFPCPPLAPQTWDYGLDFLWKIDGEETKMFPQMNDQFLSGCCYQV